MTTNNLAGYDIVDVGDAGPPQRIEVASLRITVAALLESAGYPPERAALVADSLVDADMRGVSSHGVTRVRIYTKRVRAGLVDPLAQPTVTGSERAGRLLDAKNAPGQVAADLAIREAAEGARALGVCVVGVVNSNHCGALSYFLRQLAAAGMIGFGATNGPSVMTYFGGRSRAVGTNPLGYAIPRPDGPPILLDMATSTVARGKIIHAARTGVAAVPEGWAVDVDGRPTTDPSEALAGAVLPIGGAKGSGLAMGIDILCGTLLSGVTGAAVGDMYEHWDRAQKVGHVFAAMDPACWGSRDAFDANIRRFVSEVASLPAAVGHDRVQLPGEVENRAHANAQEHGVLLPGSVIADLRGLAAELDVADGLRPVPAVN